MDDERPRLREAEAEFGSGDVEGDAEEDDETPDSFFPEMPERDGVRDRTSDSGAVNWGVDTAANDVEDIGDIDGEIGGGGRDLGGDPAEVNNPKDGNEV